MVKKKSKKQIRRRVTHQKIQARPRDVNGKQLRDPKGRKFNYDLDYKSLDVRKAQNLYRVGVGEQGVLLVEPYKSEILPFWKFKTPADATKSSRQILKLFRAYRDKKDFVGMDMARKFLQMGFTRSRRYANHASGTKYDKVGKVLPRVEDPEKAKSAAIFYDAWKKADADPKYSAAKSDWKSRWG